MLRISRGRGSPLRGNRTAAKPPWSCSRSRRMVPLRGRWWPAAIPGRGFGLRV